MVNKFSVVLALSVLTSIVAALVYALTRNGVWYFLPKSLPVSVVSILPNLDQSHWTYAEPHCDFYLYFPNSE